MEQGEHTQPQNISKVQEDTTTQQSQLSTGQATIPVPPISPPEALQSAEQKEKELQKVEVRAQSPPQILTKTESIENPPLIRPPSEIIIGQQQQSILKTPRSGGSPRRSNSPTLNKGKLEIVTKLWNKEEEKSKEISAKVNDLREKKRLLEQQLKEKQEALLNSNTASQENEQFVQSLQILRKEQHELTNKIEDIRLKKDLAQQEGISQIQRLKAANKDLQSQIQEKNKTVLAQKEEFALKQKLIEQQRLKLQATTDNYQSIQTKKAQIAARMTFLRNSKNAIQNQLSNKEKVHLQKQTKDQKVKGDLLKRIAEAKERINNKKQELASLKSKQNESPKKENQQILNEIKNLQKVNLQLGQSNKQLEEEIRRKAKQSTVLKDQEKKKQKAITELKAKSEQYSKKIKDLKAESTKIDAEREELKKIVKYEEKIPEQLLALLSKNETIRKEIKQTINRYEAQRAEMDKLVPPSVIESMNKKISAMISNNEKLTETLNVIEEVSKQNKKLDEEKDKLEWGENDYLMELDTERKRQEEKNKIIEQQLVLRKKNLQQLNSKLEEYVKQYPDFKPQKKKKQEPIPQKKGKNDKNKKSNVLEQESESPKQSKKKKNNSDINLIKTVPVPQQKVEDVKQQKTSKKKSNIVEMNLARTTSEAVQKNEQVKQFKQEKISKKKKKEKIVEVEEKPEKEAIKEEPVQQTKPEPKVEANPLPEAEVKQVKQPLKPKKKKK